MHNFDGHFHKINVFEELSVNSMLDNGGILQSPSASIGDNPAFSFLSHRRIIETHFDRPNYHREM